MPIQIGAKGATIDGVNYPPYAYLDWLSPVQEGNAVQGGDAFIVPARGVVSAAGKRRAARIFFDRLGTVDNTTPSTYGVAAELQQHFDAVSMVIVNNVATSGSYFLCKLSVADSLGDGNNNAGSWQTVFDFGGDTGLITPVAPSAARQAYLITRPLQINSLARVDGGTKPLIFGRAYCLDSNAALPCYGTGSENLTNWAARTDGRLWMARSQAGDQVSTPTNWTSTTNISQSPIVGFVYWARGQVVGFAGFGDSTHNGQGTFLGEGWIVPALNALAASSGVPIEYANFNAAGERGFLGTNGSGFLPRALDVLRTDWLRPDAMILQSASLNPISAVLTEQHFLDQQAMVRRVLATAAEHRVRTLLGTTMPITTAGYAYGATDAFRVAANARTLAAYSSGVNGVAVIDTSAIVGGQDDGTGQIQMPPAYALDGIHLNDSGNALIVPSAAEKAANVFVGML